MSRSGRRLLKGMAMGGGLAGAASRLILRAEVAASGVIFSKHYDDDTVGQAPPGTAFTAGTPLVQAIFQDPNGYTPDGFTNCVEWAGNQVARLRYAFVQGSVGVTYRFESWVMSDSPTGLNIYISFYDDANNEIWCNLDWPNTDVEYVIRDDGVNNALTAHDIASDITQAARWFLVQVEVNFTAGTFNQRWYSPGETQDTGFKERTSAFAAWDGNNFAQCGLALTNSAAGSKFRTAQMWAGLGSDAYPEGVKQTKV